MTQPSLEATPVYRDRSGLITALLSVAIGVVVIIYASGMPEVRPGIPGPGLFPTLIGGFMILFGVPLALLSWFRAKPLEDEDEVAPSHGEPATAETVGVTEGALASSPRQAAINAIAFIVAIAFYIVAAEPLGFMLTMTIITVGLMLLLRVKPWKAVVIGFLTALSLWALFEKLLLVQLPNGFLGIF